jgi:Rrf2 family iron-sulfur cluster assembly transcriptional regulator
MSIATGEVVEGKKKPDFGKPWRGVERFWQGGDKCLTHALWRDLSDRLTGFLNNITIGELVNNQEVLDVSDRQHSHESQRNTRTQEAINVKLRA